MSVYSITFKPLSVLTNIPDAQTIFGAFCYKYASLYGNEDLENLLKIENSNNPVFLISSMFFNDTLPFPTDFMPPKKKSVSIQETTRNKKLKKIKYISKKLYIDYVVNNEDFVNTYYENISSKYIIINDELLAHKEDNLLTEKYLVRDTRTRNSFSFNKDEKELFKDEVFYCNDKLLFTVYLNILNNDFKEKIINTFAKMNYVFFGGKKSVGYNLYSFIEIKEEDELNKLNHNMLVSKSLVDKDIDLNKSYYTYDNVNNKHNINVANVNRKQVNVLKEGSVLFTDKPFVGGLVQDDVYGKTIYQYYLGMLI